jgi:outer membrane protein assembly factor BamB
MNSLLKNMKRKAFKNNFLSVTSVTSPFANMQQCLWTIVFMFAIYLSNVTQADAQSTLGKLTSGIDRVLMEQNEQDIRAWLDARIKESGDFGVYNFGWHLSFKGDTAKADLNRGGLADAAAQFFRAYEMLGDKKYLNAGLKTADFFLKVQQPAGHFPSRALILRSGKLIVGGGLHPPDVARMEDGYQFRPFCLLVYAYKLTGDARYRDGAIRCGNFYTQYAQNPKWGWCPSYVETTKPDPYADGQTKTDVLGVAGGGSYADAATTDGFRASVIMYHLTKDKKYLARSAKLGEWIFATQMGKGKVRGWADNFDANNKPVTARNFEGLMMDPRDFNRATGPLLVWLYAMTGQERYRQLFDETYEWLRSKEQPDGWASEYDSEGNACWTQDYKTYRYDQPETWPKKFNAVDVKDGKPAYSRMKVQIDDAKFIYDLMKKKGYDGLRTWFRSPVKMDDKNYAATRSAAAQRCTDNNLNLPLQCLSKEGPGVELGSYLERVRLRLAAPNTPSLPTEDKHGRKGLVRQSWQSPHVWSDPYRPPLGWASWQYVWDARLALGQIDNDFTSSGGRGLWLMHLWPEWDVMGDWTTHCIKVDDWMDVPLSDSHQISPTSYNYKEVNMQLCPKGKWEIGEDAWGKIVRVNMLKIRDADWKKVPGVKKAWRMKGFEGVEGMAFHPVISEVKDVNRDKKPDIFRLRSEHAGAQIERLRYKDGSVVWVSEPVGALYGDESRLAVYELNGPGDWCVFHADKAGVYCFDAATGKTRWRHDGGGGDFTVGHFLNREKAAVVIHANGIISCLDENGKRVWSHDTGLRDKAAYAHQLFIADADNDGLDEILVNMQKKTLALRGGGKILWEDNTQEFHSDFTDMADVDEDGRMEFIYDHSGDSSDKGPVLIVDALTGVIKATIDYHAKGLRHAQQAAIGKFDPSRKGLQLAICGKLGKITLWDASSGDLLWTRDVPATALSKGDWNGDGNVEIMSFAMGVNLDGIFTVWNGKGERLYAISFLPSPYNNFQPSPQTRMDNEYYKMHDGGTWRAHAMSGGHEGIHRQVDLDGNGLADVIMPFGEWHWGSSSILFLMEKPSKESGNGKFF